jgi:hypothetical protein
VGETIVNNQGSEDCKQSGNQGWLRSINKNFGHPFNSQILNIR